jgi:hypothetical protein
MGRHSAPDSEEEELSTGDVATTSVIPWGRHAGDGGQEIDQPPAEATSLGEGSSDASDSALTDVLPVDVLPTEIVPTEVLPVQSAPVEAAKPVATSKTSADPLHGTRGDLHLLRDSHALRMRCAAAVLVPFVIYTVVLVALGRTDVYLIWLWIPTVLAGILVGALLDMAHRRLRLAPESVDDD